MSATAAPSFKTELRRLLAAGYSALFTETTDTLRLRLDVEKSLEDVPSYEYVLWDHDHGFHVPPGHRLNKQEYQQPLAALTALEHYEATCQDGSPITTVVVMSDMHPFLEIPKIRAFLSRALIGRTLVNTQRNGNVVLYFVQTPAARGLHAELKHLFMPVSYKLPGTDDLREVVDKLLESLPESAAAACDETRRKQLVQALRGLTLMQAEEVLSYCMVAHRGNLGEDAINSIKDKKAALLASGGAITYIPESQIPATTDLAGFDEAVEHVELQAQAYLPNAREAKIDPPRGLVLIGVPGAGKTQFCKAIAAKMQQVTGRPFPLFWVNVGALFDSLIGSSEARLEELIGVLEAQHGCIAIFDEMEKMLAQSGTDHAGDSGVSRRLLGRLLQWMAERTQQRGEDATQVYLAVTMNKADNVPPEFFRRFDETFWVDLPGPSLRRKILEIHAAKRGLPLQVSEGEWLELVQATENFVGSELEDVVTTAQKAAFLARDPKSGAFTVTYARLKTAAEGRRHSCMANLKADDIQRLRDWCKTHARPAWREERDSVKPKRLVRPLRIREDN